MTNNLPDPEFSRVLRGIPLWLDAVLCVAVTLACSLFSFGSYIDKEIMNPFRVLVMLLMILNWLMTSFTCGKKDKIGFIIFTAAYWLIPTAISIISDEIAEYGSFLYNMGETARILTGYPFTYCAGLIGIPEYPFGIALALFSAAVFFIAGKINFDKEE